MSLYVLKRKMDTKLKIISRGNFSTGIQQNGYGIYAKRITAKCNFVEDPSAGCMFPSTGQLYTEATGLATLLHDTSGCAPTNSDCSCDNDCYKNKKPHCHVVKNMNIRTASEQLRYHTIRQVCLRYASDLFNSC